MVRSQGSFADACSSWLSSISQCCAPLVSCLDGKTPRRSKSSSISTTISWPLGRASDQDLLIGQDDEKSSGTLVCEQPATEYYSMAVPETTSQTTTAAWKGSRRKSRRSNRTRLSIRKHFQYDATTSSRRPQISAPTDFRHLNSSSFQFPPLEAQSRAPTQPAHQLRTAPPARRSSFRPLELSIYAPYNKMSPILPHFDMADIVSTVPAAHLRNHIDDAHQLNRQKSYGSLSFHVPRKQIYQGSPSTTREDELPPAIPPKAQSRRRAYTSPEVEDMKERVASAMLEVEKLQRQIDEVIERQSLYVSSRPSTAHSMARTLQDESEPMPRMPSIPALPPAAPSFAERLNSDIERPHTAPIRSPMHIPNRLKSFDEASSTFNNRSTVRRDDRPPPPPLPLVLRPPLRKKKSFSRVSTWLFPGSEHSRELSLDSVTNVPRPIKGTDGFYQCVPGNNGAERRSFDTLNTVSTWESDDEERTVPTTTWSPESTPVKTTLAEAASVQRTATFGRANS